MVEKNTPEESQVKEVVPLPVVNEEVILVQEDAPVSEVDDVQDSSQHLAVESNTKAEEQPKKSCASIVSVLMASSVRFHVFAYMTLLNAYCLLEVWIMLLTWNCRER